MFCAGWVHVKEQGCSAGVGLVCCERGERRIDGLWGCGERGVLVGGDGFGLGGLSLLLGEFAFDHTVEGVEAELSDDTEEGCEEEDVVSYAVEFWEE